MDAKTLLRRIEQAIIEGRTDEAIAAFSEWTQERDEEAYHLALTLAGRWTQFKEERRAGILSPEESERRHNKIHYDLLLLARGQAEQDGLAVSPGVRFLKRNVYTLIATLWTLAGLTALWLWYSTASCVDIELEVLAREMEFTSAESGSFFDRQILREAQLQNYGQLTIPADTIDVDWDLDGHWDHRFPVQTNLVLQPAMDGSTLLKNVSLASFDFAQGTFIALEATGTGGCNLNLAHTSSATVVFYLNPILEFQSASNTVSGWDVPEYEGETFLGRIAYRAENVNLNVEATGIFQVMMSVDGPMWITRDLLLVDTVRWETTERTPQGPKQKSTVLGGQLDILSTGQSVPLKQGESLRLRPSGNFCLKSLSRDAGGLHSVFSGEVEVLSKGLTPDQISSCMPTRLEKAWATQKAILLLSVILLLAVTLGLLYWKRKNPLAYET